MELFRSALPSGASAIYGHTGSPSLGGAYATQSTSFSRTILEVWRRRKRAILGEQRTLAFLFEATVCVGRSTGSRPVADASLVIRSVELRRILLASSCAAHENGNGN
jgi:hypothetical protein